MEKDKRDFHFGLVAVQKKFVAPDQIIDALGVQFREYIHSEKHRRIGEILVDEGHMTQSQVDEVLEELEKEYP